MSNYERLETYGDSVLSMLITLEIYLNKSLQENQDDLSSKRRLRISNENFMQANINKKIYKYMLVDSN